MLQQEDQGSADRSLDLVADLANVAVSRRTSRCRHRLSLILLSSSSSLAFRSSSLSPPSTFEGRTCSSATSLPCVFLSAAQQPLLVQKSKGVNREGGCMAALCSIPRLSHLLLRSQLRSDKGGASFAGKREPKADPLSCFGETELIPSFLPPFSAVAWS